MSNNSPTLYLSRPILQIGGANAPEELMKDVLQISVEESLHLPAMFTLVIHNVYVPGSDHSEAWQNEKYFKMGDRVSIGFVGSTTEDPEFSKEQQEDHLIEGEITAIEVNFTKTSEAHLVIRGYDVSHRLHRGRFNRSFLNVTDSDIVRKIAAEAGISIAQVDNSGAPHDYVFQENQTNMEFLRERAARIGFELFVQNNKLYFRQPKSETSLSLDWLVEISSFSVRVTSAEQVSAVEVRGWDYSEKKLIQETANAEKLVTATGNGKGSRTSTAFQLKESPKMTVVDQPIFSASEAKKMAQALCNELGGEYIYADAKAEGNPKIRPGGVVELKGMGDRYSGKYYVTETHHLYSQRVYRTDFSVRGLRDGNLLSTLSPPTRLQPGQTLMVGVVTHNSDPKGWGRVKVKLPTLTETDESNWARVIGLGASNDRGFYCLPEIEDEVLVGFEHGDIHRPYVIGGVWNGKDKTVETVSDTIQNGKVRLRTIKTRTGHTIQFVEEDAAGTQAGIYITTTGGHKVHLTDSEMAKGARITTSGGHKVHLIDTPDPSINIETAAKQHLTLNDVELLVDLQTAGRISAEAGININVTAPTITIEAEADVNITSPLVTIEAEADVNVAALAITIEGGADVNIAAPAITLEAAVAINMVAPIISIEGVLLSNGMPVMVIPV